MKAPLLVDDLLRRVTKPCPDKTGVVDGTKRFTYRQIHARVNQRAHGLLRLGVKRCDRICMLRPNSQYFFKVFFGVSQVGATLVLLN